NRLRYQNASSTSTRAASNFHSAGGRKRPPPCALRSRRSPMSDMILDSLHDFQRDRQRIPRLGPRHRYPTSPPRRGDEALELAAERLRAIAPQLDPLDQLLDPR